VEPGSTVVLRSPNAVIVAEPESDSNGNVMPRRREKSARIAG